MIEIKRIPVGTLRTNCYLLFGEGDIVVVDPGGDAKEVLKEVEDTEGEVRYIVCTHDHPDHNLKVKKIAGETGGEVLKDLKEGEEIKIGESSVKVLKMAGHTKEDVCLLGDGFIVTGDLIFIDGHGRTDLPGGSEEEMKNSLARLLQEVSGETVIYPGHGEPFLLSEWRGMLKE